MAAFITEHSRKLKELEQGRKNSSEVSPEETDYLLRVAGLVKDFYTDVPDAVQQPRASKTSRITKKPRKRREPTAIEKSSSVQAWADVKLTGRDGEMYRKWCEIVGRPTDDQSAAPGRSSQDDDICPECNDTLSFDRCQSFQVCQSCGFARYFIEGGVGNLTYDQEMSMETTSNSPYEKINHLNEILASVQGKETTSVPDAVVNAVRLEFKKDGIKLARLVTPAAVLAYLKKLGNTEWVSPSLVEHPWHQLVQQWVRRDRQDGQYPDPEDRHENASLAGAGPQEVGVLELLLPHGVGGTVVGPCDVHPPCYQDGREDQAHIQQVEQHCPYLASGVHEYLRQRHPCILQHIIFQ